jgi:smad nuclear-interacting protein 1
MKEERVLKGTCPKYNNMSLEAVKVKKEPLANERRRNRWGNEKENATSTSWQVKQEQNSEEGGLWECGKKADPSKEEKIRPGQKDKRNFNLSGKLSLPVKQEQNGEEGGLWEWGKKADPSKEEKIRPGQKDKRNFNLSGKLAEDTNIVNGVVVKYSQPPEARKPKKGWRVYPFKGDQGLPVLYIHRQSSYLIGRDRRVVDFPVDHPSCSKQHAALQYRLMPVSHKDGTTAYTVRPYIIDLESTNGTYVNNVKLEPRIYVELLEKDVIKFGYSTRDYVILHEQSKD